MRIVIVSVITQSHKGTPELSPDEILKACQDGLRAFDMNRYQSGQPACITTAKIIEQFDLIREI